MPGAEYAGNVIIHSDEPEHFDGVVVRLKGYRRRTPQGGSRYKTELLRLSARATGKFTVEAGDNNFWYSFTVPADLPPTYDGRNTTIRYTVEAHVLVPWWFDRKVSVNPMVSHPQRPPVDAEPFQAVSKSGSPPDLEVRLNSAVVAAGGMLRGAVALSNADAYCGVEFLLRARERVDERTYQHTFFSRRSYVTVTNPYEGQIVNFELPVPRSIVPTYRDDYLEINWYLRVTADNRWRVDPSVELPLEVVAPWVEVKPTRQPLSLVGAERTYAWWNHAAKKVGLRYDGTTLRGTVDYAEICIERHYARDREFALVATVRYPWLGMGLSIEPTGRWRDAFGEDIELGIGGGFDSKHRVMSREAVQVRYFAIGMAKCFAEFDQITMDDDQMRVIERDSFERPDTIESLAKRTVRFARTLASARVAVPPPAAMALYVDAWIALAEELGGTFEAAAMYVHAVVGGTPVRMWTALSDTGEPTATKIDLAPPRGFHPEAQFVAEGDDIRDRTISALGAEAATVERACRDAVSISVDANHLIMALPAPYPEPVRLAGRVRMLQQLVSRAGSTPGPFR